MFGDGSNDNGSAGGLGESGGLSSGGFNSGNDSSCTSANLGSGLGNMGGFGGLAGNQSSYSSPDGGISSHLDGGSISAPSGGYSSGSSQTSESPNASYSGAPASSADTSTQSGVNSSAGYASTQTSNDNNGIPSSGYADASQTDSSEHISGVNLSSAGLNGFNSNTTNDNTNGFNLNGVAGSSLTPQSIGITGGTPYTNGISSSDIGRDLSTITTANYDNDMHSYFNDTSGIQKTEETLAKIDSAWDTAKQWGNETFVKPLQEAWNATAPIKVDTITPIETQLADGIPGMTQQKVESGLNRLNPTATLQNSNAPDNISDWATSNGITPVEVKSEGLVKTLSKGMGWDDDHGNPVKNTFLNSGDAGVAEGVSKLKTMTYGTVSAPTIGYATELYTAEKSLGVSALKGVTKFTGALNIISTGYDIYGDCQKYEGKNLAKAVGADLASYGLGLGAAALCVTFGAPVITGIGVCTGVAVLAGYATNAYKDSQLSPK